MTPLQQKELRLLQLYIGICEALELRYYLVCGTALGAVKYRGFIPWDDDVDVAMPREDYEVFLRKAPAMLPEGFFLQNYRTDPAFPQIFSKLRDSDTTYIEKSSAHLPIHHGMYIDIFPLDYYPEKNRRWFWFRNMLLRLRITYAFSADILRPVTRLLRVFTLPLLPSLRGAIAKREKLFRSVTSGSRIANHCGAWGAKEIVPAHWYGEGTDVTFEGLTVRAPKEYASWLTQVYGDYMQLPPEEKRIPHHFVDAFDLEKPYHQHD